MLHIQPSILVRSAYEQQNPLCELAQLIETFSPDETDEPFDEWICHGQPDRSDDPDPFLSQEAAAILRSVEREQLRAYVCRIRFEHCVQPSL